MLFATRAGFRSLIGGEGKGRLVAKALEKGLMGSWDFSKFYKKMGACETRLFFPTYTSFNVFVQIVTA